MIGQTLAILAMALVVSSRIGSPDGNVPRVLGVDALLFGAVLVVVSTVVILYAVQTSE